VAKQVLHKLTIEEERATVIGGIAHHIDWVRALLEGDAVWRGFDDLDLPREGIEGPLSEIEARLIVLKRMTKTAASGDDGG
jgi:hypothetical protein